MQLKYHDILKKDLPLSSYKYWMYKLLIPKKLEDNLYKTYFERATTTISLYLAKQFIKRSITGDLESQSNSQIKKMFGWVYEDFSHVQELRTGDTEAISKWSASLFNKYVLPMHTLSDISMEMMIGNYYRFWSRQLPNPEQRQQLLVDLTNALKLSVPTYELNDDDPLIKSLCNN